MAEASPSTPEFEDAEAVEGNDWLWRRVISEQIIYDDNLKRERPTSAVFKDPELSAGLEKILRAMNRDVCDYAQIVKDPRGVVSFQASLARQLGRGIHLDPTEEEAWHVVAFIACQISSSQQRKLANTFATHSEVRILKRAEEVPGES